MSQLFPRGRAATVARISAAAILTGSLIFSPALATTYAAETQPATTAAASNESASASGSAVFDKGEGEFTNYTVLRTKDAPLQDPDPTHYTFSNAVYRNPDGSISATRYAISIAADRVEDNTIIPKNIYVTPFTNGVAGETKSFPYEEGSSLDYPAGDIPKAHFQISQGKVSLTTGANNVASVYNSTLGNHEDNIIWVADLQQSVPEYLVQTTHYFEEETLEEIHKPYEQWGWQDFDYTTEPLTIPGYEYVRIAGNQNGAIAPSTPVEAGDMKYYRNVVTGPGSYGSQKVTIYRAAKYLAADGTYEVTAYVVPADANDPANKLPESQDFFENMDKYTVYENKVYASDDKAGENSVSDQLAFYRAHFVPEGQTVDKNNGSAIKDYLNWPLTTEASPSVRYTMLFPMGNSADKLAGTPATLSNAYKPGDSVSYYYKKIENPGSVVVNYVDEEGNVIQDPVTALDKVKPDTEFDTTTEELKPQTITTKDGKKYELVKIKDGDKETGTVEGNKTTEVTYIYREVKGDVVVEYKDEQGNPLTGVATGYADSSKNGTVIGNVTDSQTEEKKAVEGAAIDTPASSIGSDYSTADSRPSTITTKDGKVYTRIEKRVDGSEEGKIVEGTTHVVYYYELAKGDVDVTYINTDGTVIKPAQSVVADKESGTPYDATTDQFKPETIKTEDGKTYKLVAKPGTYPAGTVDEAGHLRGSSDPTGTVSDKKQTVTYVYEEVKDPSAGPTGDVIVHYVDEQGKPLADDVIDTNDAPVGQGYDTTDAKPSTITKGGKVYDLVKVKDGDKENGKVVEGTSEVTYVYKLRENTTPATKTGDVIVHYVEEGTGKTIAGDVTDTKNGAVDSDYDTTDVKPQKITTEEGKTYELVKVKDGDKENGKVTEKTTEVTYEYKEVKGNVVVHYVDTEGNVIAQDVTDTPDSSTGTAYDTTDNKPETIKTNDGKTYKLVPVLTKGSENGKVVEGTTEITYVYTLVNDPVTDPNTPSGDVTVHYVDESGTPIADPVKPIEDSPVDDSYNTTPVAPQEIVTKDGKTYERVPEKDPNNSEGKVTEGNTDVTYTYKEVKGKVVVHYVDTEGNVIAQDETDTPDSSTGTAYDTTDDHKPSTITKDGKTYELVPVLTKGAENGTVVKGTTEVTYVYKLREDTIPNEPTDPAKPEAGKGNVIVHFVEKGTGKVVSADVVDTLNATPGSGYDTSDHKYKLVNFEGVWYKLVGHKAGTASENGEVVEGLTEVTYEYEKVNSPAEPNDPESGTPGNPVEEDPKDNGSDGDGSTKNSGKVTLTSGSLAQTGSAVLGMLAAAIAAFAAGAVALVMRRRREN
ncbi:MucBP domain-containing protein [Alloscardovia omnicolens]|uniref:MucBP domain-containing protein n=1 Tax=Alloscardovia omnicolens TaxID=419015 RepID=UPI003A705820